MNILYDQAVKAMNAAITKAQETRNSGKYCCSRFRRTSYIFCEVRQCIWCNRFCCKKARTAVMFGTDSDIMGSIIAGSGYTDME